MSPKAYAIIREERPDLFLPAYLDLSAPFRNILPQLTGERLIARRTAMLLSRQYCQVDDFPVNQPEPEPEL